MEESKKNILKKVLIHVIGWPLFVVSIYFCFIGGMYIGWAVQSFDERLALVSFIGSTSVFSFLSSYIFATLIFKRKSVKMIFSSLIALFCMSLLLWYSYLRINDWGEEKLYHVNCALRKNPGHNQWCLTMTEQERKQYMKDNDITEKDLEEYEQRYPEK